MEAQTQATEKAGLPSYGGIDADMVLKLMGQRGAQDAQMAGQTGRDMQGMYQGALTQQLLGDPQRREQDIRANLVMKMMAERAAMDRTKQMGDNTIAAREVPQAQTSATQSSLLGGARQSNEMANWLAGGGKDLPVKLAAAKAEEAKKIQSAKLYDKALLDSTGALAMSFNESDGYDKSRTMLVNAPGTLWGTNLEPMPLGTADLGTIRELAKIQGISTTAMGDKIYEMAKDQGATPFDVIKSLILKVQKMQGQ